MVRRASFAFSSLVTLVTAMFVAVMGACSSLPDLHFEDGTEGGPNSEGGPGGEGGPLGEGGSDARSDGNPTDAPVEACVKTGVEICDDGIDNDCNGHTDCDDPACTAGFVCTDPAPSGWDLVGFAPSARPACPANYGAASDVSTVAGTGDGTCSCQCSAAVGSTPCNAGQATATVSDQPVCLGGATSSQLINASAATCTPLPSSLTLANGTAYVSVTPHAPPAACTAATTIAAPPVTDGRVCAPPARFGGGCQGMQVCAPRPTGMAFCTAKAGAQSCPSTYPTLNTAGSPSPTDTRGCNLCTCAPQTSCTETATLYTASDCTVAGADKAIPLTTTCTMSAVKNGPTATAYKAVSAGTGCAPVGFNPATTGSVAFVGPETVCCK